MPKIVFKFRYIKPGVSGAGNYVRYIATRDGVEYVSEASRNNPASAPQKKLIGELLKDYPDADELLEYQDYIANPTMGNASEFITQALDHFALGTVPKKTYLKYIAERPNVEKRGSHGLFSAEGSTVVLAEACREAEEHTGNVWTHIISLRRKDAVRLSYDSASQWQSLLSSYALEFAERMKIEPAHFKWYAAYHNESHHPHVHLVCWSEDPSEGFLTEKAMEGVKSDLATRVFRQDMVSVYEQKTSRRNALTSQSQDTIQKLCADIRSGLCHNQQMELLLLELSTRLKNSKGKKQYGYLSKDLKNLVDSVVDELEKESAVSQLYDAWYEMRNAVYHTYTDHPPPKIPLSAQKEFKRIRNMVIEEALRIGDPVERSSLSADEPQYSDGPLPVLDIDPEPRMPDRETVMSRPPDYTPRDELIPEAEVQDEAYERWEPPPEMDANMNQNPATVKVEGTHSTAPESPVASGGIRAEWSKLYKQARRFLYGSKEEKPDHQSAYDLMHEEAMAGNVLAMHDLGRMYADGLGMEADQECAQECYVKTLSAFHQLEPVAKKKSAAYLQYRIGKMYRMGLGTEQDDGKAADWLSKAADENHRYAQYSLASLYYRGNGVEQSYETALSLYQKSAAQSNAYASYELGKMHRNGIGTKVDRIASHSAFRDAFHGFTRMADKQPDDKLHYRLGQMLRDGLGTEEDLDRAAEYFTLAASAGNSNGQYALAQLYLKHANDPEKIRFALDLLHQSAKTGNSMAEYALGKLYRDGLGEYLAKDTLRAVDLLSRSAARDNDFAAYALGKLYLLGEDLPQDTSKVLEWLGRSAELGNQFSQYSLGKLYLEGEHAPKDVFAAVELLRQSALQKNEHALYLLGKIHLTGEEVPQDVPVALEWLRQSAELGNQFAQYTLGKIYLDGNYAPKDVGAGIDLLRQSAMQGNEHALYLLGKLHLKGEEVTRDVSAALEWLRQSAALGNQFAQYTLGKVYLEGETVPKDVDAAIGLLQESAAQNNQYAAYQLGKLYALGRDVPRDRDAALHWLGIAAAQGNGHARFFIDHIDEIGVHKTDLFVATTDLLRSLGRLFEQEHLRMKQAPMHIDRKRWRILREKKIAQGHAQDDKEQTVQY